MFKSPKQKQIDTLKVTKLEYSFVNPSTLRLDLVLPLGILSLSIYTSEDFPATPPIISISPLVQHPLIDERGVISSSSLQEWNPSVKSLGVCVLEIITELRSRNPTSLANTLSGKLQTMNIQSSNNQIFDSPDSSHLQMIIDSKSSSEIDHLIVDALERMRLIKLLPGPAELIRTQNSLHHANGDTAGTSCLILVKNISISTEVDRIRKEIDGLEIENKKQRSTLAKNLDLQYNLLKVWTFGLIIRGLRMQKLSEG